MTTAWKNIGSTQAVPIALNDVVVHLSVWSLLGIAQ